LPADDSAATRRAPLLAGEAFIEQIGAEHRGFTENEACVMIVTYAGTPGMPRSIASPGEKSDH